jgi:NAD(P)H dehydrogenase (quinone)
MKVLIVLAHHEPSSFNAAMAATASEALTAAGHTVVLSDLYGEDFNPVGDRRDFLDASDLGFLKYQIEQQHAQATGTFAPYLAREQARLQEADLLILQFPMWWFGVPGILKGWIDKVFAAGFAYGGGRWFETGRFRGKRAILSLTMSARANRWGENALFGPIEWCLHPIHAGVFNFCGIDTMRPHIVHAPAALTPAERELELSAWSSRCAGLFAESPLPFRQTTDFEGETYRGV